MDLMAVCTYRVQTVICRVCAEKAAVSAIKWYAGLKIIELKKKVS